MLKSDISRYRQEVQVKWEVEIQCRLKHVNCLQLYTWFHDKVGANLVAYGVENSNLYYQSQLEGSAYWETWLSSFSEFS